MKPEKSVYCLYDENSEIEYAKGCLKIFLPVNGGYVNYNIVRSVREEITADVWRLGQAFLYDEELSGEIALTRFGAEWDMAVHIENRDDFIGGSNHGDEISSSPVLWINGVQRDIYSVTELTPFDEIRVSVDSVGYDPDDHVTKALLHHKEYTVSTEGVVLRQSVEWLNSYRLTSSFLAMMPPLKALTDHFFTDKNPEPREIVLETRESGVRSATLFGKESGISYTMEIPEYPIMETGDLFFITDNNKSPYNKMYYYVCRKGEVKMGEVWRATTKYCINKI